MFVKTRKIFAEFRDRPALVSAAVVFVFGSWAALTYAWRVYLDGHGDNGDIRWILALYLAMTTFSIIMDVCKWLIDRLQKRTLRNAFRTCVENARQADLQRNS